MSEKLDAAFGADAADYIRQLQAEIERLTAALKPFSRMGLVQPERDDVIALVGIRGAGSILNGDIVRARRALEEKR